MNHKPVILIADDDRQLREALAVRLVQAEFEVVSASDARTAIGLFDRRQIDAAILDVEMPDSDGLSVCEHIRESGSDIPVFILTGSDSGIVRKNLGKLTAAVGASHFITKPYDGKSLVMMLHEAVRSCGCSDSCVGSATVTPNP